MRRVSVLLGVVPVLAVALAGCASSDGRELRDPGPTTTDPFAGEILDGGESPLTVSGSWVEGEVIDPRHTCRGEDISPALSWTGGPLEVASWAVVAEDDTGAVHWIVVNLSPETRSLAEGETDPLAVIGENSAGRVGWTGPCPSQGEMMSWTISVFAVSQVLEAQQGDPAESLYTAVASAAIVLGATTFTSPG